MDCVRINTAFYGGTLFLEINLAVYKSLKMVIL